MIYINAIIIIVVTITILFNDSTKITGQLKSKTRKAKICYKVIFLSYKQIHIIHKFHKKKENLPLILPLSDNDYMFYIFVQSIF